MATTIKSWVCWCGRGYMRGEDSRFAILHREWHKKHEDGDALPEGSKHKETRSWSTIRPLVLNRDNYTCRACGKKSEYNDSKIDLEVHHITAKKQGGTDHPTNLITLCQKCHNGTKRGKFWSGNPAMFPLITLDEFMCTYPTKTLGGAE